MPRMGMIHASNETILVGVPRKSWQMLADTHAGNVGGDGAKFASEFDRGVRLQVEGVDLARPAKQVDHHTSLGPVGIGVSGRSLRPACKLWQEQPQGRQTTGLQ